ncbi:MAG: rhomboid family intramembrane serine protease [Epsilonproteobacteria bacterium]|nr:rhomboid family intramembrane serine protease [Campylobacterota bacterium]
MRLKKGFTIYRFREYPVTYGLITLNLIVFLITVIFSGGGFDIDIETLINFGASNGIYVILGGEQWRLFTAMFLHGGAIHILTNMLSLWFVGRAIERIIGAIPYLVIYLLSGTIGGLISIYFHNNGVGIGASGAIFGIFGAMAGVAFADRYRFIYFEEFFKNFGVILLINIALGVMVDAIDLSAHIGGLAMGILGGYMVGRGERVLWLYVIFSITLYSILYNYLFNLFSF